MAEDFDCIRCGACCVNPETNRLEQFVDYVEVKPKDALRRRPELLRRFAVLECYDNVRPHRLPGPLADSNPTGRMWRLIDGTWTQS